jgi:hypothetical protein
MNPLSIRAALSLGLSNGRCALSLDFMCLLVFPGTIHSKRKKI